MNLFSFLKNKQHVGIEITSNQLRLMALHKKNKILKIDKFELIDFPKEVLTDHCIKQPKLMIKILKMHIEKLDLKHAKAVIAMPSHKVISRRLKLPLFLDQAEYESEITDHLYQYFPGLNEELYFDFALFGLPRESFQEILLFVAYRSQVDSYVDVINQSGLQVEKVDVASHALVRSIKWLLNLAMQQEVIGLLIIDVDVQLIIFSKEEIIVTHTISINKKSICMNDMFQEFKTFLQRQSLSFSQLSEIIIVDDDSLINMDELQAELTIPYRKIDLSSNVKKLELNSPKLLTSLGLILEEYPQ